MAQLSILRLLSVSGSFSDKLRTSETALIEYIAKLDISAFVFDYDHNAYDIDLLKATHLNMYKTVRKYKPYIPYIIITRPDYWTEP